MGMLPPCETEDCNRSSGHPGECRSGVASPGYQRMFLHWQAIMGRGGEASRANHDPGDED
jgi:hypothetical protein